MKKFLLIAVVALMAVTASAKGPKTGFRYGVNTGYVFGTKAEGLYNNWNVDLNAGCQILPWLYVGGGVGLDVYTKKGMGTPLDLPIFAETKFFLPTSTIAQPYIGLRGGYAVNLSKFDDNGIFEAAVGVELADIVNVSIGYSGHYFSNSVSFGGVKLTASETASGVVARVGVRF